MWDFLCFWTSIFLSFGFSLFSRIIRWSEPIHALAKSFDRKLPRGLKPLPVWEKLSARVVRILGQNPSSHHLQGTNTYLIGTGKHRILVDAGEGMVDYHSLLEMVLQEVGCEAISAIILTHWHIDHVGGVQELMARFPNAKVYKRAHPRKESFAYTGIQDGQKFEVEGATLTAVYTSGHTEDHCSFILEEDKAIVCGDMILGCGTAVFDDLHSYMNSLQRIRSLAEKQNLQKIYVGHGPHVEIDAVSKITWYINHRQRREDQILQALKNPSAGLMTSFQITRSVYGAISIFLLPSAHFNVEHHLDKLLKEGTIKRKFGYAWILMAKP